MKKNISTLAGLSVMIICLLMMTSASAQSQSKAMLVINPKNVSIVMALPKPMDLKIFTFAGKLIYERKQATNTTLPKMKPGIYLAKFSIGKVIVFAEKLLVK